MKQALKKETSLGFTLAEVLIALALLGIVAAFTIPKILQASGEQEKLSKMKEAVALLSEIVYKSSLNNDLTPRLAGKTGSAFATELATYFSEHVNALTSCPISAQPPTANDPDCWPGASLPVGSPNDPDDPGLVLPNGVFLTDFEYNAGGSGLADAIWIDYNGKAGPNTVGTDQVSVNVRWGNGNGKQAGTVYCWTLGSGAALDALNLPLCNQIMSQ